MTETVFQKGSIKKLTADRLRITLLAFQQYFMPQLYHSLSQAQESTCKGSGVMMEAHAVDSSCSLRENVTSPKTGGEKVFTLQVIDGLKKPFYITF